MRRIDPVFHFAFGWAILSSACSSVAGSSSADPDQTAKKVAPLEGACSDPVPPECAPRIAGTPRALEPLGSLPGAPDDIDFPWISADGATVVGNSFYPNDSQGYLAQPWRWKVSEGLSILDGSRVLSLSRRSNASGSVTVGLQMLAGKYVAARWLGSSVDHLGLALDERSQAVDSSDDGLVVVGYGDAPAATGRRIFRWTADRGVAWISMQSEVSFAVSGDGAVLLGASYLGERYQSLFRWREGRRELLSGLPGAEYLVGSDLSHDGTVAVGAAVFPAADSSAGAATHAVLWTAQGTVVDLGVLPAASASYASAVSADGTVVVGASGEAMIWDAAHGMRAVRAVLAAAGVDAGAWTLDHATSISADGKSLVGYGRCGCGYRSWFARLP